MTTSPMATISHLPISSMTPTTCTSVSADAAIIANQAVEIMHLQNKVQRLGNIEQSYAQQQHLLDNTLKSKQATQEIFFKSSMENKELQQNKRYLQHALSDKDALLVEYKQDSHLELDSLQRLHAFQIRKMSTRFQTVKSKNECLMQVMHVKQSIDTDLCDMKYDALLAKYQYLSTEHKTVCKQLSLCHTQLELAAHESEYLAVVESALLQVSRRLHALAREHDECQSRVARKHDCVLRLSTANKTIRAMHAKLARIVQQQDTKLAHLISANNKLNTIIEHHDRASGKMQQNFQRDLASKAAVIAKLETQMDAFQSDSHSHQNANDSLKQQHEVQQAQLAALRNDKLVAQKEMEHLQERLASKDSYVDTLKQQSAALNENMNRLHDENAAMQNMHSSLEQRMKSSANESEHSFKSLTEKHKHLQTKTKQLAAKLQQIYEDKKTLKKQVIELKQQCQQTTHARQESERESEQQCDAMQASLEKFKTKLVHKNETLQKLENALREEEHAQIDKNQQIAVLQQENESLKFLLQTLEVDQKQLKRKTQKHNEYSQKTKDVVQRIVSENQCSTEMNLQVLDAIAEDDRYETETQHASAEGTAQEEEESEDQDSDLERDGRKTRVEERGEAEEEEEEEEDEDANEDLDVQPTSTRNSNKRRRLDLDESDYNIENNEEPPRKRARIERTQNQQSRIEDTPFKGSKEIYSQRQRNKNKNKDKNKNKNIRIPKPRLK